jgi:hypothetical protein
VLSVENQRKGRNLSDLAAANLQIRGEDQSDDHLHTAGSFVPAVSGFILFLKGRIAPTNLLCGLVFTKIESDAPDFCSIQKLNGELYLEALYIDIHAVEAGKPRRHRASQIELFSQAWTLS